MLEQVHRRYPAPASQRDRARRDATGFETVSPVEDAGRLRVQPRSPSACPTRTMLSASSTTALQVGVATVAEGGAAQARGRRRPDRRRHAAVRRGRELYGIDNPDDRGSSFTQERIAAAIGIIPPRLAVVAHVTGDAGVDVVLDGTGRRETDAGPANQRPAAYRHSRVARTRTPRLGRPAGRPRRRATAWHCKDGDAGASLGADTRPLHRPENPATGRRRRPVNTSHTRTGLE